MLGNSQGVVYGAGSSFSVDQARLFNVGSRDFTDFGSPFGSELFDVLEEGLRLCGSIFDELCIDQSFPLNHMRHREKQCDIRSHPDR